MLPRSLLALDLGSFQRGLQGSGPAKITDQDLQQLCQGAIAKHISPADIEMMGKSMGLTIEQTSRLRDCVNAGGGTSSEVSKYSVETATPTPQQPIPSGREASAIERRFHELDTPYKLFTTPRTNKLEQFGYDLFSQRVSTFAPLGNVPVSDDYILGPDDELIVYTWGRVNETLHLRADRDGSVMVPEVGPVQVAGLSFAQAKKLIEGRMRQITGVQVDVTMGQVRSIQVFVIGKVKQPGLYTVSALSHVSNALDAAGGIDKTGSLRGIELRRDNRVVTKIDLYQMLLHGDTSADVRLKPRDAIFVPVIGPVVAITGDVKSSGIYELKGDESLGNLLRMVGGVTAFGYSERLQVERVQNHQKRVALDVNLNDRSASQFAVDDGDLIKVFTVLPAERNVVRAQGNFNEPGTYEWHQGMRVADLVRDAQGPADHTFFDYALLQRRDGPDRRQTPIPLDLDVALSDPRSPDNILLRPDDAVTIYSASEISQVPTVSIQGEVRKPGTYPLTHGLTVRELVYLAGGLLDNAARDRAELTRTQISDGAMTRYIHMDVDLRRVLSLSGPDDVVLQPSDELLIQEASNWHEPWHVLLKGEVMRPGPYAIQEGQHLASVLEASGGFRSDAYPRAAIFTRKSIQKMQEEELSQARTRLKNDITRLALMPRPTGKNDTSLETLNEIKAVLAQTEGQQALGRMVVHVSSIGRLKMSADNVMLENGDTLIIPRQPASIQVLGSVYTPNAIVYQPGLRVMDYLQRAGGPTEGGDVDHIYVIKADGEVMTDVGVRESAKNRLFPLLPAVSGGLMAERLEPGDTIYVPERLIYVDSIEYTKDVTQIIANAMTSFAILGILGSTL